MRIVVCHNYYQQPGGEDQVFAEEVDLLRQRGHEVTTFTVDNDEIAALGGGIKAKLKLARNTIWNAGMYDRTRGVFRRIKPQVVHFHNTFPLISPAGYAAAHDAGAGVVQTLHNYRLLCPGSTFLRDGKVCEDCLGKTAPWPGALHACYRGDRGASTVTAAMLTIHRAAGTYRQAVDVYVLLTEFARRKFVAGGLPASRIVVKPNSATDHGVGAGAGGYALFAGRLDPSKGLDLILAAWEKLGADPRCQLRILGDGPMADVVRAATARHPNIQWLGRRPLEEVYRMMGDAAFLLMSSQWYEGLPRTIVESFSKGTPIIVPKLGAMAELVDHERTGLHFAPGDVADLARQLRAAFDQPERMLAMRPAARREYESKYTANENYRQLLAIYETAIARHQATQARQVS